MRALLGARLASALALSALATIVGFQVYELTKSPLALGLLGLVEAIPALTLSLYGGHLADRRDRRQIIIFATIALVVAALALAFISRPESGLGLAAILAVIFLTGIAAGLLRPAQSAFEAQVVPIQYAATGASWLSTVSLSGNIVGPAIGGIVAAIFGVTVTYIYMAALLCIEVGCYLLIARKPAPPPVVGESIRQSVALGVRYVLHSEALIGSMALDLFAVLFGGAIALLPIFATDILHVGPAGLGLLRTAPSIGALVVMLAATRRPPMRHAGSALLLAVAGFGVSIIVFALSTNFLLSFVALFFSGLTDGISMIIRSVILRIMSPEHLRGRIASVNWIFIGASNEIGAFESGIAASLLGTVPSVVAGGVMTLLIVAFVAVRAPGLRRLNLARYIATGADADTVAVAVVQAEVP